MLFKEMIRTCPKCKGTNMYSKYDAEIFKEIWGCMDCGSIFEPEDLLTENDIQKEVEDTLNKEDSKKNTYLQTTMIYKYGYNCDDFQEEINSILYNLSCTGCKVVDIKYNTVHNGNIMDHFCMIVYRVTKE